MHAERSPLVLMLLLLLTSSAVSLTHWAVYVDGGIKVAREIADRYGFEFDGQVGELENVYHFVSTSRISRNLMSSVKNLQKESKVKFLEKQQLRFYEKKDFKQPTDPYWDDQWSLNNDNDNSMNVLPAWIQGFTGKGVTVGIVDDGLMYTHPDLAGNYDDNSSYDFVDYDNDPAPYSSFQFFVDDHGTKCAGIVSMAKSNGICGTGIAYDAKLAGLRLISNQGQTDIQEALALNYHFQDIDIYSNSWGPSDVGFYVEGPRTLSELALKNGALKGRNGKGSIYVWASGNGGPDDSCSADGYVNSIYTIAIGSVDYKGRPSDYDEKCSSKIAVTFCHNPDDSNANTLTTSRGNKCTATFKGTSAATPIAAGVIALALEANPSLTWRDVQYLIIHTSNAEYLNSKEYLWSINGAGLKFSHQFGFGAIDGEALVTRARYWTNVPKQIEQLIVPIPKPKYVSNKSAVNITWEVTGGTSLSSNPTNITYLEHIILQLTLSLSRGEIDTVYSSDDYWTTYFNDHDNLDKLLYHKMARRGDISITLTSPSGTRSNLLDFRDLDYVNDVGYDQWPFMSLHFWGENPTGTWTCTIAYRSSIGTITVNDMTVKLYGVGTIPKSIIDRPICPTSCHMKDRCSVNSQCDICKGYRDAETLQCLTHCDNDLINNTNYCISSKDDIIPSLSLTPLVVNSSDVISISDIILPSHVLVLSSSSLGDTPTPLTSNVLHDYDRLKKGKLLNGISITNPCTLLVILAFIMSLLINLC